MQIIYLYSYQTQKITTKKTYKSPMNEFVAPNYIQMPMRIIVRNNQVSVWVPEINRCKKYPTPYT